MTPSDVHHLAESPHAQITRMGALLHVLADVAKAAQRIRQGDTIPRRHQLAYELDRLEALPR